MSLLSLLFPRLCIGCGEVFSSPEQHKANSWDYCCPFCASQLRKLGEEACGRCGRELYGTVTSPLKEGKLCGECQTNPPSWGQARSLLRYLGPARRWVKDYKFKNARYVEREWEKLLRADDFQWVRGYIAGAILVPVPLHPLKKLLRGFNQSEEISHLLRRVCNNARVENLLSRVRWTRQQARLHREARMKNVKNAFQVNERALERCFKDIKKKDRPLHRLIVVDDILTTGVTLSVCSAALRRAGFTNVDVLTIARG